MREIVCPPRSSRKLREKLRKILVPCYCCSNSSNGFAPHCGWSYICSAIGPEPQRKEKIAFTDQVPLRIILPTDRREPMVRTAVSITTTTYQLVHSSSSRQQYKSRERISAGTTRSDQRPPVVGTVLGWECVVGLGLRKPFTYCCTGRRTANDSPAWRAQLCGNNRNSENQPLKMKVSTDRSAFRMRESVHHPHLASHTPHTPHPTRLPRQ